MGLLRAVLPEPGRRSPIRRHPNRMILRGSTRIPTTYSMSDFSHKVSGLKTLLTVTSGNRSLQNATRIGDPTRMGTGYTAIAVGHGSPTKISAGQRTIMVVGSE